MRSDQRRYIREHCGRKTVVQIAQDLGLPEQQVEHYLKKRVQPQGRTRVFHRPGETLNPKFLALALGLITLLGLMVYANSFAGQFLWDDWHLIADNTYIRSASFENIRSIFSQNIMAGAGREGNSFRPLQILSYLMDHAVWDKNVLGYHLTNTGWHILAAWAVFYFSFLICGNGLAALLCAGLFVIHPVHTEAVTYLSGRADPMAAFFVLAAACCYVRGLSSDSRVLKAGTLALYVLALLSRENALVFVLVPLLYHYIYKRSWSWKHYGPVLLVTGLYIVVRLTVLGDVLPKPEDTTIYQRAPGFLVAYAKYLGLLLWPRGLHMEYGDGIFPWGQPLVVVGAVLFVGMVFSFWKMRQRIPLAAFSIGWFLIFLAPHTNLAPINAYMAEHWLYLPSLGFFLIVAVYFVKIMQNKMARSLAVILLSVWVLFLGGQTVHQNIVWRDPKNFYEYTLKYAPESARIRNNLAMIYSSEGRLEESVAQCLRAIKLNPHQLSSYNTLASVLLKQGKNQDAVEVSQSAIKIDPKYVKIYNQLAIAFIKMGRTAQAIQACETAIALKPRYAKPHDILGAAYMGQGIYDKAQAEYMKALELSPRYPEGWHNLGILYQKMGKPDRAAECFLKAVSFRPSYVKGYWNLGKALSAAGREPAAVKAYKKAVSLAPGQGEIYLDLANSYFRQKRVRQASEAYEQAQKRGIKDPVFSDRLDQVR